MNEQTLTLEIFITGGSGYLGRSLIPRLREAGHSVRALVRQQSQAKLPPDCTPVVGDVLDNNTYRRQVPPAHTCVHLVGVSHPGPWKAEQFRRVHLASVRQALEAAQEAGISHFIYVPSRPGDESIHRRAPGM